MVRPSNQTRNTREEILNVSMTLFATRGFKATTVKEIAATVGIKDASLYNHFPGKQAIFDAIIERELTRIEHAFQDSNAMFDMSDSSSISIAHSIDQLEDALMKSYEPFFTDAGMIALRKMLTVNQFESEQAGVLYRRIFLDQPLAFQTSVFERLIAMRAFAQGNARIAAYESYGPVFVMLSQGLSWKEAQPKIRALLRAFERSHNAQDQ
ncbi:TetR/AcrR family transcriptional regulator [Adlercreutzia sp. ZJ138]|uniref:TetR/AcrR family transcriptional regulator n=1 Tax=Adlercreutzia sp. ZJ138 TaxID=2709405 RepID=UPI0013EE2B83|nr:TetR/AcrR family transcriptional regulator [Adlercreutzia sp. ZJ138]